MTQFVRVEAATGRILCGVGRRDPVDYSGVPDARPFPHDGMVYYAWQERLSFEPPTPTSEYRWIDGAPRWIDLADLEQAKAHAWEAVKAARDAAEVGVFEFEGGLYDINKQNVTGAAVAALMAQLAGMPFSRKWTLADNSEAILDGPAMQRLGLAMVDYVDGLHATGRDLRERIAAATTPEEAYALTWPTE